MKYRNPIKFFSVSFTFFCRCDDCGKSFVDKRSLMRHAKIHVTNKPFKGCVDANFCNFFAGAMFAENLLSTSGPWCVMPRFMRRTNPSPACTATRAMWTPIRCANTCGTTSVRWVTHRSWLLSSQNVYWHLKKKTGTGTYRGSDFTAQ